MRKGRPKIERITKVCIVCGKYREWTLTQIKKRPCDYCSVKCRVKDKDSRITKTCKRCEKVFKVFPSKKRLKYCSPKCWYKEIENNNFYRCKRCDRGMWVPVHRGRKRYCSTRCSNMSRRPIKVNLDAKQEVESKGVMFRCPHCREVSKVNKLVTNTGVSLTNKILCYHCNQYNNG